MARRYLSRLLIVFVLLTTIGVWQALRIGRLADAHEREKLLTQAITFAKALPLDQCKLLTFTAGDLSLPVFPRLQNQLSTVIAHMNSQGLYLLAERDGQWVTGPTSYFDSQTAVPRPGTPYLRLPPEASAAFDSCQPQTTQLYTNENGICLSAFVPVIDTQTGKALFLVGADMDLKAWRRSIRYARAMPLSATFILLILCLIAFSVQESRHIRPASARWSTRYAETLLCSAAMLTLTATATWYARLTEERTRAIVFIAQAQLQVDSITQQMYDIHDKLAALNHLFQASGHIAEEEFHRFVSRFTENASIRSVVWLPAVPAPDIVRFEDKARQSGKAAYRVWQFDAQGNPAAAAGRNTVYPALYLDPAANQERGLGFDFSSDAACVTALQVAVESGLPMASDPVRFHADANPQGEMFVLQAISSETQTGVVAVAVSMKTLVTHPLNNVPLTDTGLDTDLYLLQTDKAPIFLASSSPTPSSGQGGWEAHAPGFTQMKVPIFCFDKTYAVVLRSSAAWLAANPLRESLYVLLGGLLLTLVLSALVALLSNRQLALEQEVQSRTADLQTAHDNINSVLNAAPMAMLVVDEKACVCVANKRASQIFHSVPGDILNHGCGVLLSCVNRHDDPRGCGFSRNCAGCALFGAIKEMFKTGKDIYDRDMALTLEGDGTTENALLRFSVSPVIFNGKRHAVVALQDITAWHRSEQLYQTLFREMHYGFSLMEPVFDAQAQVVSFRYLAANPAFERLTNVQSHAILGNTILALFPDLNDALLTAYAHIAKTGEACWTSFYSKRLDRYFEGTVFLPIPNQLACVFTDITDRKRAEERASASAEEMRRLLNETEAARKDLAQAVEEQKRADQALLHERNLLYALMDNLPDRIYFKDIESRFLKISKAHARSLGLHSPAEAVGKSDADFKPAELAQSIRAKEQQIISTGQPLIAQVEQKRTADGRVRWVSASKAPIKDKNGQVVGIVGISRDITPEIELQQQLQQAMKMDAIGRLAGGVAHDFNNLLQVILGFTEVLLAGVQKNDPQYEDLQQIERAAKRAADLTRQLLAFSRKQRIQPQLLDINKIILATDKMLRRLMGENIEIVPLLEPNVKTIRADPNQIEQILLNLAINARDSMPQGGRLTFKTENVELKPEDTVMFPESSPGLYTCLSVSDTGSGIKPEVLPHLFEPFYTTKSQGKGTGLGLSVIYGIVKQNGGWINVYSEEGQGSTFKLYLPSHDEAPEKPETAEQTQEELSLPGLGKNILLVEDESGVRSLSTLVLQGAGYKVVACENAQAAKVLFAHEHQAFDLLFSDVVLSGQNGIDLAHDLRAQRPDLPVLLCSGYADDSVRWESIKKEGFHFLPKPYPTVKLLLAVREAISPTTSATPGETRHEETTV